ncbi:terpene synthase family protein [Streptomyces sp. R11]|uniref:Terpene synthase family protein n=1 Tax=Streptomyces sp. R11 TaxID=3238625 RepID=A0AB39NBZ9_9ACTN
MEGSASAAWPGLPGQQAMQPYLDNAGSENGVRALCRVPPPAELLRRRMLAIEFYLVLIEAGLGLCLSAASLANVARATEYAQEHIALTNDLFSSARSGTSTTT